MAGGGAELRGEKDLLASARHRAPERSLRARVGIVRRGVEVVDAAVERLAGQRLAAQRLGDPRAAEGDVADHRARPAEPPIVPDSRRRPVRVGIRRDPLDRGNHDVAIRDEVPGLKARQQRRTRRQQTAAEQEHAANEAASIESHQRRRRRRFGRASRGAPDRPRQRRQARDDHREDGIAIIPRGISAGRSPPNPTRGARRERTTPALSRPARVRWRPARAPILNLSQRLPSDKPSTAQLMRKSSAAARTEERSRQRRADEACYAA